MILVPALLLALAGPSLLSVRVETVDSRPALLVQASRPLAGVDVRRTGGEVVILLPVPPPANPPAFRVLPPIEVVRLDKTPSGTTVRVRVAAEVPYEVRRDGASLTVLFGRPPRLELQTLYAQLRPPGLTPTAPEPVDTSADEPAEGITLGRVTLRPALLVTYVDAEAAFLDDPQPERDQYVEIRPQLAADMPVGNGRLTASYQLRHREASSFAVVEEQTHLLDAGLEMPIGTRLTVAVSHHFASGALEVTEVDPGREFFFRLGRFRRHQTNVGARIVLGGPFDVDFGVDRNTVNVADDTGFFDYETRTARAGFGYDLGAFRLSLNYGYDDIPAPDERPAVEAHAHSVALGLTGEPVPLVTGELTVGYRDHEAPLAAPGGQRFRGLALSTRLTKEFTRSINLSLLAGRNTPLSAFEQNAFYVSTFAQVETSLTLPADFAFHGGVGYHWNDYRTVASELGRPREDRVRAWSVGLARPITSWSWVRADYRNERRYSNLDRLEADFDALTIQAGVRFYRSAARP